MNISDHGLPAPAQPAKKHRKPLRARGHEDTLARQREDHPPRGHARRVFRAASGETRFSASGEASLAAGDFLNGRYSVSLESPDLEPYLAMNAFAVPGTAFGVPVSLKAALDIDGEAYTLSAIDGTLDGNGLAGRLSLARGGPVASLKGALTHTFSRSTLVGSSMPNAMCAVTYILRLDARRWASGNF